MKRKLKPSVNRSKVFISGKERVSFHNEVIVLSRFTYFRITAPTLIIEFDNDMCFVGRINL